jgi:transposase
MVYEWFYFLSFIQNQLVLTRMPGDVEIMDNLSAHKVAGVKEAIEKVAAHLLYLPPYSPDFSPIELAWSKMKNTLRKKAAATSRKLHHAICQAFLSITENNSSAWFKHGGYNINTY